MLMTRSWYPDFKKFAECIESIQCSSWGFNVGILSLNALLLLCLILLLLLSIIGLFLLTRNPLFRLTRNPRFRLTR